jgi:predicted CopG family antitoxin
MAKQIAISDDVYQLLVDMKGKDKSFSEVIRSLAGWRAKNKAIMKFAGVGKNDSKRLEEFKKFIEEHRKNSRPRHFE